MLPMNAPDAAAKEAERVLKNGANAIQLGTNANGEPLDEKKFWPIYEIIAKSGRPILLHPARTREMPDYPTEKVFEIRDLQRARLALRDRRDARALRVLRHHRPQSRPQDRRAPSRRRDSRISKAASATASTSSARAPRTRTTARCCKSLKKRPYDYFKDFYGDTAVEGARAATVCGIDFFTPEHVVFASDCPFDKEKGPGYIRDTIKVLNSIGPRARRHGEDLLTATRRSCSGSLSRSSRPRAGRSPPISSTRSRPARRTPAACRRSARRRISAARRGSAAASGRR